MANRGTGQSALGNGRGWLSGLIVTLLFLVCAQVQAQVKPNRFPRQVNPDSSNFEVYSQKSGINTRANLHDVRRYMAARYAGVVAYVPAPTGNPLNRMDFVKGADGLVYYIDAQGQSIKFEQGAGGGGTTFLPRYRVAVGNSANEVFYDSLVFRSNRLGVGTFNPQYGVDMIGVNEAVRFPSLSIAPPGGAATMYHNSVQGAMNQWRTGAWQRVLSTPVAGVNGQIIRFNNDLDATASEVLVFRNDNLGINRPSPLMFFDANGARPGVTGISITNTSVSGYSGIRFNDTGSGEKAYMGFGQSGVAESLFQNRAYIGSGDGDMVLSLNRTSPLMFFKWNATAGNQQIGIGTATPNFAMDFALPDAIGLPGLSSDPLGRERGFYYNTVSKTLRRHDGFSWGGLIRGPSGQIAYGSGTDLEFNSGFTYTSSGLLVTPTVIGTGLQVRSSQAALVGIGPLTGQLNLEFGYASGISNFFNDVLAGDAIIRGPAVGTNRRLMIGIESNTGSGPSTIQIGLGTVGVNLGTTIATTALHVNTSASALEVGTFRNLSSSGYSSIIFRDAANALGLAVGVGNSSVPASLLQNRAYFNTAARDFVFTSDAVSAGLFFQQSTQNLGVGNVTSPTQRIHVSGNIRTTGTYIFGANQTVIAEGSGSPEGFFAAPPGSLYANNTGVGPFSLYIKASGTGNTGWVPNGIGAERQLSASAGGNTFPQALFDGYRDIFIFATVLNGAVNDTDVIPPAPSAANQYRSFTVLSNDADATRNVTVSSTSGLWYTTSGTTAPSTQSTITLTGSATSLVVAKFTCLDVGSGTFRWVLQEGNF
jgi:hypothetical protein